MLIVTKRKNKEDLQNPMYSYRYPTDFWSRFKNGSNVTGKAWRTFTPALEKLIFRRKIAGNFF